MIAREAIEVRSAKHANIGVSQGFNTIGSGVSKRSPKEIRRIYETENLLLAVGQLRRQLKHAVNHVGDKDSFVYYRDADERPQFLTVMPVAPERVNPLMPGQPLRPCLLVAVSDQQPELESNVDTVARAFELTPAEAEVLALFARGANPQRIADHTNKRLATVRKATMDLAHKLGAMPSRKEIATELGMGLEELDGLLRQALTTSSLDAPISGEEGRSFLGELIADPRNEEPLDAVERRMHHEQLGRWLSYLTAQEKQVLEMRFGLGGEQRHTLAEIGRLMEVSRERVRQVELKALRKLRNLTRRVPTQL